MTNYTITVTCNPDDDDQPSELADEQGKITRQGYAVVYAIEKYGYTVEIHRAE